MRHVECCHTPKREPLSHASTRKGRCGSTWAQQIGAFALKGVALHYYAHHIGDFIRDTSRLSDAQTMAYLRLIWLYYETERPLPDDKPALAMRIGSDVDTVAALLSAYFTHLNGVWNHKRIDSEIRTFSEKQARAKQANASRWSKRGLKSETLSDADKKRHRSRTDPNQEPITNNQEPKNTGAIAPPDGVPESVWQDFKELRKRLKAPITQTALDGIAREASKKRLSLEDALRMCCERSWRGFKADWVPDSELPKSNEPDPVLEKLKHDESRSVPMPPEIKSRFESLVKQITVQ